MEKFTVHTGLAVPLRRSDVDTDQIIPAEYLKRVTRTGFDDGLFRAWRADPGFVLNNKAYTGASILVAGPRFGVGSSREHAVWALQDFGFRAVIAPSYGDIFRNNALKVDYCPRVDRAGGTGDPAHWRRGGGRAPWIWCSVGDRACCLEASRGTTSSADLVVRARRPQPMAVPGRVDDIGFSQRHERDRRF